jgi:drug/metabolite transporter (DMT)-like permease
VVHSISRNDVRLFSLGAAFTVLAAVTRYVALGDVTAFVVSGLCIAVLAALVGRSVDNLGDRFGSGATGVLQSALGNQPELFVCIFALRAGLVQVVEAAIVGSILGNILLVLGAAMLVGGLGRERQFFSHTAANVQVLMLLLAVGALVLPAARGAARRTGRAQYGHAAVAGLLLHAGYLGGVFYAISVGVPAGVSAVVVSLQPVLTALLATRLLGERPALRQWLGLLLGVVGVALVVAPDLVGGGAGHGTGAVPVRGLVACLVALASTTAGTLYQKRHGGEVPLLWGTAVQYAAASAVLLALAAGTERVAVSWTGDFVAAFVWLVLGLSIGAVLLLLLLLRRGTASSVASLFYLVPPATAVEALLLFGERLVVLSLVGLAVAVVGVALVVVPARRAAVPAPAEPAVEPGRA